MSSDRGVVAADSIPCKEVLYCGRSGEHFVRLVRDIAGPSAVSAEERGLRFVHPRAELLFRPAFTCDAALSVLEHEYVNLVVVDLREGAESRALEDRLRDVSRLLSSLDDVDDPEARYGFHRILVLVSSSDGPGVDRILVELGGYGIRHVLKQQPEDTGDSFGRQVIERALTMLDRAPKKTALCAAGGGITAIFFELGALKCFDDCFGAPGSGSSTVSGLDLYFGISAGAVVTSLLANGYSAEELMASIAGVEGGRIAPIDLSLVRLGHVNIADYGRRFAELGLKSLRSMADMARGRGRPTLDGLFLEVTAAVGAPFRSDRFEEMVRRVLTAPGATNDFRELGRELYIGASNQDSRRHVLFGDDEHEETPISLAVQASLSINPAFSAVEIDGAWYEDGAVTRTSNFVEAINRGANLIFVLDPFVPYVSKDPGFANRRGMLFNIDQDVRSLSFTRFEAARNWALRRHPEVASYTFLPNNRLRRLLSINPMDHRPYLEIFRASYLATLNRITQVQHRLAGDLAVHGISLDTSVAEEIAARLRATETPSFADFYVDGRVDIRRPPLSRDASASDPTRARRSLKPS